MVSLLKKKISTMCSFGENKWKWFMSSILIVQAIILICMLLVKGVIYGADSLTYIVPAKNLLAGNGLMDSTGTPILFRTPGYSFFLSVIYSLTGGSDYVVVILQIFMVLMTTWMLFYLTSTISKNKVIGCIASLFYVCDLAIYELAVSILSDTIFAFLLTLSFLLFYRYWKSKKMWNFVACVLILNYAMLVRPQIMYYNMFLFIVFMVLALIKKVGWKECVIYCSVFVLFFGGWSLRNYSVFGNVMYSSVRAESYYLWYAPCTYSLVEGVPVEEANIFFEKLMDENYPNYNTMPKIEQVNAEEEIGWNYIKEHIPAYLLLNLKGLGMEMIGPNMTTIFSWNLPTVVSWMIGCYFAGLLLLSYLIYAVGFLRTIRKQTWLDWLILLTVMYLMASTAVLGYCRFRLAFYPLCLIGTFSCWKPYEKRKNGEQ